jgi:SAM-dependent methyltransferase
MSISPLAARLAGGHPIEAAPDIVDLDRAVPPNPPEQLQKEFVGLSFEAAYAEADTFVSAFSAELARGRGPGLATGRVLDFGSGWGRISRVLLAHTAPQRLFAVDVDPEMTALVNTTLPGINAMTVSPQPPTVLGDAAFDSCLAFSVFSHLSGAAHRSWAHELGRVVRPGGMIAITVLGEDFLDLVAGAQGAVTAGTADDFAAQMATVFPDLPAARRGFHDDQVQFGATGGGGVRTSDYYGWAVASRRCVERTWAEAGFRLVRWWPSGELFPQAMAVLERTGRGPVARRRLVLGMTARQLVIRSAGAAGARLPAPVGRVARGIRGRLRNGPGGGTGRAD